MKNGNAKFQPPDDLAVRVKIAMQVARHKQKDVKIETGVDQSQISRILNGKYTRMGRAVRALNKYANMQINHEAQKLQGEIRQRIRKAVDDLWDGNVEDGKSILYMLELIRVIMSRKRPNGSNG